jgi:hypothetical protein
MEKHDTTTDHRSDDDDHDDGMHPSPPSAPHKLRRRAPRFFVENWKKHRIQSTPLRNLVDDYYRVETIDPTTTTTARPSSSNEEKMPRQEQQQQQQQQKSRPLKKRPVKVLLPGVPKYEEDWQRDTHDFFNLVALVPVCLLNAMNWDFDQFWNFGHTLYSSPSASWTLTAIIPKFIHVLEKAWVGEYYDLFFRVTAMYFILDWLWIMMVPGAVKSPTTILQHHVAVLLYMIIPQYHPEVRWCMGLCMSVELNTWFLIARRVFNKQGFPPWKIGYSWWSIRIKVISVLFYTTWLWIRVFLYPILLWPIAKLYLQQVKITGSRINSLLPGLPLHVVFCVLNLKWSYDLLTSKIRYWRRQRAYARALRQQQQQHRLGNNDAQELLAPVVDTSISKGL